MKTIVNKIRNNLKSLFKDYQHLYSKIIEIIRLYDVNRAGNRVRKQGVLCSPKLHVLVILECMIVEMTLSERSELHTVAYTWIFLEVVEQLQRPISESKGSMMQASSAQNLVGLARAASSLSGRWQRSILHSNLLQNIFPLKSDHLFHSTSAISNPLHRSPFTAKTIHQRCPRTEILALFRTSHSALKPLSQYGQGCRLLHTSKPSDFMKITSRLSRPNIGQYLFRNCPSSAQSNHFVPGPLRFKSSRSWSQNSAWRERNKSVMLYVIAGAVLVVGFSYAAVPLYTVFCQATGLGGQATAGHDIEKVETMAPVRGREIVIRFNADTAASMRWNFRPQQSEVKVVPGETALAFYSAMNPTDKPIVGISTYNVVPFDAGQYFNKIQCFCFEEQRLNPHEQVDMPVFFYIDPDFDEDPKMVKVNNITLSYTFFESKEGLELPDPWTRPE